MAKSDHSSKNGVVTAIFTYTRKCLDCHLCQNHISVTKHGQSDRIIQATTNGKTTATAISTKQNCQVP